MPTLRMRSLASVLLRTRIAREFPDAVVDVYNMIRLVVHAKCIYNKVNEQEIDHIVWTSLRQDDHSEAFS